MLIVVTKEPQPQYLGSFNTINRAFARALSFQEKTGIGTYIKDEKTCQKPQQSPELTTEGDYTPSSTMPVTDVTTFGLPEAEK